MIKCELITVMKSESIRCHEHFYASHIVTSHLIAVVWLRSESTACCLDSSLLVPPPQVGGTKMRAEEARTCKQRNEKRGISESDTPIGSSGCPRSQ